MQGTGLAAPVSALREDRHTRVPCTVTSRVKEGHRARGAEPRQDLDDPCGDNCRYTDLKGLLCFWGH